MAREDIYGNKAKYKRFMEDLDELIPPRPGAPTVSKSRRKYFCQNPTNLQYFKRMATVFAVKDLSYVRRLRLFGSMLFIVHATKKDLAQFTREDIEDVVRQSHEVYRSSKSREDLIRDIKHLWRTLFPECDRLGRPDETLTPYVVRHLRPSIDKSRETMREDRLTWAEFERLVKYFDKDPATQAIITLAYESFGRPQEILMRRMRDVEVSENYARIWVSSHGKEGVKFLQCIDSFPYLMKWLAMHPHKSNRDAFLFCCKSQWDNPNKPALVNQRLEDATRNLGIDKKITLYSFKRNGITYARLRGDSDVEIQHRAGWTSADQLKTYDMSTPEDALAKELEKRGLGLQQQRESGNPSTKPCACGARIGFADTFCPSCNRLTDGRELRKDVDADTQMRRAFVLAVEYPELSFAEIIKRLDQTEHESRPGDSAAASLDNDAHQVGREGRIESSSRVPHNRRAGSSPGVGVGSAA